MKKSTINSIERNPNTHGTCGILALATVLDIPVEDIIKRIDRLAKRSPFSYIHWRKRYRKQIFQSLNAFAMKSVLNVYAKNKNFKVVAINFDSILSVEDLIHINKGGRAIFESRRHWYSVADKALHSNGFPCWGIPKGRVQTVLFLLDKLK